LNDEISKIKFFRRLSDEWAKRKTGRSHCFFVGSHCTINLFTPLFKDGVVADFTKVTCVENEFGGHYVDLFSIEFKTNTPLREVLNETWSRFQTRGVHDS